MISFAFKIAPKENHHFVLKIMDIGQYNLLFVS